jgi:hypothetical protein
LPDEVKTNFIMKQSKVIVKRMDWLKFSLTFIKSLLGYL